MKGIDVWFISPAVLHYWNVGVYNIEIKEPIHFYCDNMETVDFARNLYLERTPKWADTRNIDLKRSLKEILEKWKTHFQIKHVKAHQDKTKKLEDLLLSERVNIICDEECNTLLHEMRNNGEMSNRMLPLRTNKVMLLTAEKVETGSIKEVL